MRTLPTAALAGARCRGGGASCTCRSAADEAEAEPPAPGSKRFEVRLSAEGGAATLVLAGLGRFQASGPQELCYYVDIPAGSQTSAELTSRATRPEQGFSPRLQVTEYGPTGPHWYEILSVECAGLGGRCDKGGATRWGDRASQRQRGRVDPCGSAVVTKLAWDTSSAEGRRDGGFFHDFSVRFAMEVKKFATQFPPGSTECVPK